MRCRRGAGPSLGALSVRLRAAVFESSRCGAGDVVNQARSALYLAVAARMRADLNEVLARSARAATIANDAALREYVAGTKAMDAWICVRRGDLDGALRLTDDALSAWATYGGVFPFHWLGLVPRLEAQ